MNRTADKGALRGPGERLIVALDTPSLEAAGRLLQALDGVVSFYKVGTELFSAHGWEAVRRVQKGGGRVFLDLKLHDIPNTVGKTMAVICEHEVDMVTLHALGGLDMMKRAREAAEEQKSTGQPRPILLGVTVLTSHREEDLTSELGIGRALADEVCLLASLAQRAGLDGVVSSPMETRLLREKFPRDFLMVTPGIRPSGSARGDQKRTFTPAEALRAGADYLVVGRPITDAQNPREEALAVLQDMAAVTRA